MTTAQYARLELALDLRSTERYRMLREVTNGTAVRTALACHRGMSLLRARRIPVLDAIALHHAGEFGGFGAAGEENIHSGAALPDEDLDAGYDPELYARFEVLVDDEDDDEDEDEADDSHPGPAGTGGMGIGLDRDQRDGA